MSAFLHWLGSRLDIGGAVRMRRFAQGWPAQARPDVHFHRTAKVQYRYRDAGPKDAAHTIVFSADPPMTLENYDHLITVFAQSFRVIVVELPAMGFSVANGAYGFQFRETNDDLAAFLRAVAGSRAVLAFSCVAGLAAIDIAVRYPDLVSHLALLQVGDVAAFARWKAGRDPKGILAKPVLGQLAMRSLATKRMPAWYALSVGRKEMIPHLCACAERSFTHGAQWSLASAYQIYMDATVTLTAPSQPILSLWGAADGSHPPENTHAIARLAPGLTCETYPDLGHTPELEDPARIYAAVRAFLGGNV